jgi:hypothetical protein
MNGLLNFKEIPNTFKKVMYKYIYSFFFSVIKWITLSTKNLYLSLSGEVEKQNITNSNKNNKDISISDIDEFYFSTKAVSSSSISSSSTVEKLNSFILKVDNIKFEKKKLC